MRSRKSSNNPSIHSVITVADVQARLHQAYYKNPKNPSIEQFISDNYDFSYSTFTRRLDKLCLANNLDYLLPTRLAGMTPEEFKQKYGNEFANSVIGGLPNTRSKPLTRGNRTKLFENYVTNRTNNLNSVSVNDTNASAITPPFPNSAPISEQLSEPSILSNTLNNSNDQHQPSINTQHLLFDNNAAMNAYVIFSEFNLLLESRNFKQAAELMATNEVLKKYYSGQAVNIGSQFEPVNIEVEVESLFHFIISLASSTESYGLFLEVLYNVKYLSLLTYLHEIFLSNPATCHTAIHIDIVKAISQLIDAHNPIYYFLPSPAECFDYCQKGEHLSDKIEIKISRSVYILFLRSWGILQMGISNPRLDNDETFNVTINLQAYATFWEQYAPINLLDARRMVVENRIDMDLFLNQLPNPASLDSEVSIDAQAMIALGPYLATYSFGISDIQMIVNENGFHYQITVDQSIYNQHYNYLVNLHSAKPIIENNPSGLFYRPETMLTPLMFSGNEVEALSSDSEQDRKEQLLSPGDQNFSFLRS